MKSKRTKALGIPPQVKKAVNDRDGGICIFCGGFGLPEAHFIPRSHGGLGVEKNVITACRRCHTLLDSSTLRPFMLEEARAYLKGKYPDWTENDLIYRKGMESK